MVSILKDNAYKFCSRCVMLKPISDFGKEARRTDGLRGWCKQCVQEARLRVGTKRFNALHKRSYPLDGRCEICSIELGQYCYHHWDNGNLNLGVWLCGRCDYFAEGLDEIERNNWKALIYHRLKQSLIAIFSKHSIHYFPPDDITRLYSQDGKLTHKWCPRCAVMKPITAFSKARSNLDGLQRRCKECMSRTRIHTNGLHYCNGLYKRPNPGYCELCGFRTHLFYHHWDDNNKSRGIWVCQTNKCHNLAEAVDMLDNGSLLPNKYTNLKQELTIKEKENATKQTSIK